MKTTEDEDNARRNAERAALLPQIEAARTRAVQAVVNAQHPCRHGADCLECEAERISGGSHGDVLTPEERRFVADYDRARGKPDGGGMAPYRSAWKMRQIVARLAPYPRNGA